MATDQRLAPLGRPLPDLDVEWSLEHDGTVYRRPRATAGEHHHLESLQGEVWAPEVATPAHQLIAAESCGGIVLGAFDRHGAVGLSYAFPAHRLGEVWLHSHQTGVLDRSRDRGVGATLKWVQRWLALEGGYTVISWTFDPLQSRNAYFNFSKLGVVARTYKPDCYGRLPDPSNRGLPTDRLWVEWHLGSPAVADRFAAFRTATGISWPYLPAVERVATRAPAGAASRNGRPDPRGVPDIVPTRAAEPGVYLPAGHPSLDGTPPVLRLEVPADLDAVRRQYGVGGMTAWRMAVRAGFTAAFAQGYVATDFVSAKSAEGRRSWYVLTRPDA